VIRSKVPEGWLIQCGMENSTVILVPDPRHEWDGNSLP
jgi:hypothetical protein